MAFVLWSLGWHERLPCEQLNAEGHARDLGPDFAAFEARADYVAVYVRHPSKPLFAPMLVRADARDAPRKLPLYDARLACGAR